jgi:hypothetical protein
MTRLLVGTALNGANGMVYLRQLRLTAPRSAGVLPFRLRGIVAWTGSVRRHWMFQVSLLWALAALVILSASTAGATYLTALRGWGEGVSCCFGDPATMATRVDGALVRWDSGYYLAIAQSGYQSEGLERAFFPLYPYVVRALSALTGLPILTAGLLVSALAFLGAGCFLYLVVRDFWEHTLAMVSVTNFFFFPSSFFFLAFYPEALLILFGIASYWAARREHYLLSGLCIALASAARPVAWIFTVPYLLLFLQQRDFRLRRWLEAGLGLGIGALGTILTLTVFIPFEHHGWRFWSDYAELLRETWQRSFTFPWIVLYDGVMAAVFATNIGGDWFARASATLDLVIVGLLILSCVVLFRKIPTALYSFLAVYVAFLLCMHGPYGYAYYSIPRYALIAYPAFLVPTVLLFRRSRVAWGLGMAGSVLMLAILSAWFGSGRWVA